MKTKKLKDLPVGRKATIIRMSEEIPLKLLEMGMTEGAKIKNLGKIPGGGIYLYYINHTPVALDETLADKIEIEISPSESRAHEKI